MSESDIMLLWFAGAMITFAIMCYNESRIRQNEEYRGWDNWTNRTIWGKFDEIPIIFLFSLVWFVYAPVMALFILWDYRKYLQWKAEPPLEGGGMQGI